MTIGSFGSLHIRKKTSSVAFYPLILILLGYSRACLYSLYLMKGRIRVQISFVWLKDSEITFCGEPNKYEIRLKIDSIKPLYLFFHPEVG